MAKDPEFPEADGESEIEIEQEPLDEGPLLESVEEEELSPQGGLEQEAPFEEGLLEEAPPGGEVPAEAGFEESDHEFELIDPEASAEGDPAASLGHALAEATGVLGEQEAPKPAPTSWDRYILPLLAGYGVFLTILWLWPQPKKEKDRAEPVDREKQERVDERVRRPLPVDVWDEAIRAARDKRHADAVSLLEAHLRSGAISPDERLLVYQQLAIQCRLAGQIEKSMKYAGLAHAQTIRIWTPEDLIRLAEAAHAEGRAMEARRLFARLLLLEGSVPDHLKERITIAPLRLADSYREEAERAEERR